jgi:hypothetical protein
LKALRDPARVFEKRRMNELAARGTLVTTRRDLIAIWCDLCLECPRDGRYIVATAERLWTVERIDKEPGYEVTVGGWVKAPYAPRRPGTIRLKCARCGKSVSFASRELTAGISFESMMTLLWDAEITYATMSLIIGIQESFGANNRRHRQRLVKNRDFDGLAKDDIRCAQELLRIMRRKADTPTLMVDSQP